MLPPILPIYLGRYLVHKGLLRPSLPSLAKIDFMANHVRRVIEGSDRRSHTVSQGGGGRNRATPSSFRPGFNLNAVARHKTRKPLHSIIQNCCRYFQPQIFPLLAISEDFDDNWFIWDGESYCQVCHSPVIWKARVHFVLELRELTEIAGLQHLYPLNVQDCGICFLFPVSCNHEPQH